ncbi:MAG: hypothetical protein WBQ23_15935 [Bacteroidota bacterium]
MNERIQELISAYLHRDTTPEQERELFEACNRNPETSELLRQQLVLSLSIRNLREEVQVPTELRNDVLRRINTLEAEGLHDSEPLPYETIQEPRRRFGWVHLLGTGLATAACAVAVVLLSGNPDEQGLASIQPVALQDTVYIVKNDTITQLRQVDRPVYIVRTAPEAPAPQHPDSRDAAEFAQKAERTGTTETGIAPESGSQRDRDTRPSSADKFTNQENTPLLADNQPSESVLREAKKESYIEQYNTMLVSVETVQLSSKDRIH